MEIKRFGNIEGKTMMLLHGNLMCWRQFEDLIPLLELSAVSALVALVPFVYIWKVLRDGSVICSAVLPYLHCGADVLPSVGVPGGDQSAAGSVGASGTAAAGLCRNFWQR